MRNIIKRRGGIKEQSGMVINSKTRKIKKIRNTNKAAKEEDGEEKIKK